MNILHLATETGTNARVGVLKTKKSQREPTQTTESGDPIHTERIHRGNRPLKSVDGEELLAGDPEIDLERMGMILPSCSRGFRVPGETTITGNFKKIVTTTLPNGEVASQEVYKQKPANINEANPIKMGKRIPIKEAIEKFVFHTNYAITHDDGIKFEFLYKIAKELHEKQELAILGAGPKGNLPLILRDGGNPMRGFLYGETDGEKYRLLLLLSRQELRGWSDDKAESPETSTKSSEEAKEGEPKK